MKVKDIKVGMKVKLNALGIQKLGPNRAEMLKGTLIVTGIVKVKPSSYYPSKTCRHYAEIKGDDGGVWLIYIDPVKVKHYRRAKDYLDETVPNRKSACKNIFVPKDVCYIDFRSRKAKGQIKTAKQMGNTIRGEMVVVDYDKKGRMVGIELLSNDKPCQKPPKKGTSIVTVFGDKTKVKIPKEVTGPIMCIRMKPNPSDDKPPKFNTYWDGSPKPKPTDEPKCLMRECPDYDHENKCYESPDLCKHLNPKPTDDKPINYADIPEVDVDYAIKKGLKPKPEAKPHHTQPIDTCNTEAEPTEGENDNCVREFVDEAIEHIKPTEAKPSDDKLCSECGNNHDGHPEKCKDKKCPCIGCNGKNWKPKPHEVVYKNTRSTSAIEVVPKPKKVRFSQLPGNQYIHKKVKE